MAEARTLEGIVMDETTELSRVLWDGFSITMSHKLHSMPYPIKLEKLPIRIYKSKRRAGCCNNWVHRLYLHQGTLTCIACTNKLCIKGEVHKE